MSKERFFCGTFLSVSTGKRTSRLDDFSDWSGNLLAKLSEE